MFARFPHYNVDSFGDEPDFNIVYHFSIAHCLENLEMLGNLTAVREMSQN